MKEKVFHLSGLLSMFTYKHIDLRLGRYGFCSRLQISPQRSFSNFFSFTVKLI